MTAITAPQTRTVRSSGLLKLTATELKLLSRERVRAVLPVAVAGRRGAGPDRSGRRVDADGPPARDPGRVGRGARTDRSQILPLGVDFNVEAADDQSHAAAARPPYAGRA
jgi:hypothetical protein